MHLKVLILGYGEMGHAMECLLAENHDVHIWSRSAKTSLEDEAASAQLILFCLPVNAHLEVIRRIHPVLKEGSICLTIAKGLAESGQTASQIFDDVLGHKQHFGLIYGPMIAEEIRLGRYAFADVALSQIQDFASIKHLFQGSKLVCRQVSDMTGSSWSVILKNVYAIMFGIADGLQLGANMRGHLMVAALSELSSIVKSFGAEANTPYSYAGLGDLLTTATSENSHHHELGRKLASGQFGDIAGEGVHTLRMVEKYHLFDSHSYPLFTLISDIVREPASLNRFVDTYLEQISAW